MSYHNTVIILIILIIINIDYIGLHYKGYTIQYSNN